MVRGKVSAAVRVRCADGLVSYRAPSKPRLTRKESILSSRRPDVGKAVLEPAARIVRASELRAHSLSSSFSWSTVAISSSRQRLLLLLLLPLVLLVLELELELVLELELAALEAVLEE